MKEYQESKKEWENLRFFHVGFKDQWDFWLSRPLQCTYQTLTKPWDPVAVAATHVQTFHTWDGRLSLLGSKRILTLQRLQSCYCVKACHFRRPAMLVSRPEKTWDLIRGWFLPCCPVTEAQASVAFKEILGAGVPSSSLYYKEAPHPIIPELALEQQILGSGFNKIMFSLITGTGLGGIWRVGRMISYAYKHLTL